MASMNEPLENPIARRLPTLETLSGGTAGGIIGNDRLPGLRLHEMLVK